MGHINSLLKGHNDARRAVKPYASTMPMLKWSTELAAFAAECVDLCPGMRISDESERYASDRFPNWWYVADLTGSAACTADRDPSRLRRALGGQGARDDAMDPSPFNNTMPMSKIRDVRSGDESAAFAKDVQTSSTRKKSEDRAAMASRIKEASLADAKARSIERDRMNAPLRQKFIAESNAFNNTTTTTTAAPLRTASHLHSRSLSRRKREAALRSRAMAASELKKSGEKKEKDAASPPHEQHRGQEEGDERRNMGQEAAAGGPSPMGAAVVDEEEVQVVDVPKELVEELEAAFSAATPRLAKLGLAVVGCLAASFLLPAFAVFMG